MRFYGLVFALAVALALTETTWPASASPSASSEEERYGETETGTFTASGEAVATGVTLQEAMSSPSIDLSILRTATRPTGGWDSLRLTLEDAVRIALNQNADILIALHEPLMAEADLYSAKGEFDPVLQHTLKYTQSSTSLDQRLRSFVDFSSPSMFPQTGGSGQAPQLDPSVFLGNNTISSIDSDEVAADTALVGKLFLGTQYDLRFQMNFEESTFGGYQGEYGGNLGLTLTQPILRGFGQNVNMVRIRAARNLREISEAQARLTVLNKAAETVNAYWDLVGTIEAVRVYEEALRNAERLLKVNETRLEIGTAADIDVLQAKAGVAMRQSELVQAWSRVADAGDMLKLLMNLEEDGRFSKVMVAPVDRPNPDSRLVFDTEQFEASLDQSVSLALELRPENSMSDLEIANAALDEQRTRNEMLPQFDLVGSYTRGGRAEHFGRTMTGLRDEQDRTYVVGVQASMPLGNRAARGAHQRARLGTRQAEERRKQMRMTLMMRVHHAARAVMTNKALVETNRQTSLLQEANVTAEEKRLRIGVTTSYQVLRVQEDLTAAQTQEVQSRIAFEKALVELQLAEGSLLNNLGIEYSESLNDMPPVSWRESVGLSWISPPS